MALDETELDPLTRDGIRATLEFRNSASSHLRRALDRAGKLPGFTRAEARSKDKNMVCLSLEQLRQNHRLLLELYDIVRNWKGTQFNLAGVVLTRMEVSEIGQILDCALRCSREAFPQDYCTQGPDRATWGCFRLRSVEPYPTASMPGFGRRRSWFQFGAFDANGNWIIDKSALRDTLSSEARIHRLRLCPQFSDEQLERRLSLIPEEIDAHASENWEIEYEEDLTGGLQQRRPRGIIPKIEAQDFSSSMSLALLGLSKSDDKVSAEEDTRYVPDVTFSQIGGIDGILREVREVVELPLVAPQLLERLGIVPHRGILLSGPPGCGKTLIAKAIAHEVGAHFTSVRGPELLSKWYGESEHNLRRVFEDARRKEPSVIYFDEIDSIGATRSSEELGRIDAKVVNQLLSVMDGFDDRGKVVVIASTNRPDILDPALLRPGRFDYHLIVPLPNEAGCRAILAIHSARMPLSSDFDAAAFSRRLVGLTGADIRFLCREAAYNCLRRSVDTATLIRSKTWTPELEENLLVASQDFEDALLKIRDRCDPGSTET